jgi:hypothetical protein
MFPQAFRLDVPTLAIAADDRVTVTIPRHSIVMVDESLDSESRFVNVRWKNRVLKMFTADLQERGKYVHGRVQ